MKKMESHWLQKWTFPFLLFLLYNLQSVVSLAHISFERKYGYFNGAWVSSDIGRSVQQTRDGGYIIAGETHFFDTIDVYVVKTDSLGDTLWTRRYGGDDHDWGFSVQETQDGGYVIGGSTESFGAGMADFYLIRTDSLGDTLWTRTFGYALDDFGWSVIKTSDGGFVIAGWTQLPDTTTDIYMVKTDALGNELWSRIYSDPGNERSYSVQQTRGGGYILGGCENCVRPSNTDFYLITTDSQGNLLWTRTYGTPVRDIVYSVQETQDGGYILAGCTNCPTSPADVYLVRTDSSGNLLWTRTYGGAEDDRAYSIQETPDGGFILTGNTSSFGGNPSDLYLIRTDALGDSLWIRVYQAYPYSKWGYSIQLTSDSGYIITGVADFPPGMGGFDFYLLKPDIWGPEILSACASDGAIPGFGIDDDDYVVITFDDSTNKPSIPPMFGIIDSVLSLSGGHSWRDGTGMIESAVWNAQGDQLTINLSTNMGLPTVTVGDTIYPDSMTITDLDRWENPCVSPVIITCSFDPEGVDEEDFRLKIDDLRFTLLQNHPNPFHSSSMIRYQIPFPNPKSRDKELPIRANHVTLRIYDITGRLVETLVDKPQTPGVYQIQWTPDSKTPGLIHSRTPSGIYFYRLQSGEFTSTKKMTLLR